MILIRPQADRREAWGYRCLTLTIHTQEEKMSETNKSGYELRTELLGMAIGIVESKVQHAVENEHLKPAGHRAAVQSYTTEDVIVEAEKLYQFVQKK